MVFKIEGECPIEGCSAFLKNTGALGTHLRFVHNLTNVGFRQFIVTKWKHSILDGGSPPKLSIEKFMDMYKQEAANAVKKHLVRKEEEEEDIPVFPLEDTEYEEPAPPLAPSPKIADFVESLEEDYYDEGGIEIVRRRLPRVRRPQSIVVDPELYIYYDWLRSLGYRKDFSTFINEAVKLLFRERGFVIGVLRLEHE